MSLNAKKNSSRYWLERELSQFARGLPEGAVVLDAGAGEAPYSPLFDHCAYETADFMRVKKRYVEQTYVCDLGDIPVADARFDAVVFSQVMEHVPDPARVLTELHRVMKPEGRMFLSAPFYYEEHEQPFDFYRYTQFGFRRLLEEAGFVVGEVRWLEGYLSTAGYQLDQMSRRLPVRPKQIAPGMAGLAAAPLTMSLRVGFRGLAGLFQILDRRRRFTRAGHPKNYCAVVRKAA